MKRIAMAVAIVVMAAGACKKAQNSSTAADSASMRMSDSMKMAPAADTAKARADSAKAAAVRDSIRRDSVRRARPRTRRP